VRRIENREQSACDSTMRAYVVRSFSMQRSLGLK
jgi:hypothetical protein